MDKKPILFLDYDGTLVSIRMNPEDAVPGQDVFSALNALKAKYEMWIVTGRSLKEIISFLGREYNFIALHGAVESTYDGIKYSVPDFRKYRNICNQQRSVVGMLPYGYSFICSWRGCLLSS